MPYQYYCPRCPQPRLLEGAEATAGQAVQCPYCQQVFPQPPPQAPAPMGQPMAQPMGMPAGGPGMPMPNPYGPAPSGSGPLGPVANPYLQPGAHPGQHPGAHPGMAPPNPYGPAPGGSGPLGAPMWNAPPGGPLPGAPFPGGPMPGGPMPGGPMPGGPFPGGPMPGGMMPGGMPMPGMGGPAPFGAPGGQPAPAFDFEKTGPVPGNILHIPCTDRECAYGNPMLDVPSEMVGQDATCPCGRVTLSLRYEDSMEYKQKQEEYLRRKDEKFARSALNWAIAAVVIVVVGLAAMMFLGSQ